MYVCVFVILSVPVSLMCMCIYSVVAPLDVACHVKRGEERERGRERESERERERREKRKEY